MISTIIIRTTIMKWQKKQKKHKISICKQIFPFFCDASKRQGLQVALQREFTDKRLTINVNKTKLSSFEDLQPNGICNQMVHTSFVCSHSNSNLKLQWTVT